MECRNKYLYFLLDNLRLGPNWLESKPCWIKTKYKQNGNLKFLDVWNFGLMWKKMEQRGMEWNGFKFYCLDWKNKDMELNGEWWRTFHFIPSFSAFSFLRPEREVWDKMSSFFFFFFIVDLWFYLFLLYTIEFELKLLTLVTYIFHCFPYYLYFSLFSEKQWKVQETIKSTTSNSHRKQHPRI